jgi:outer membrane protein assembly factor BamB
MTEMNTLGSFSYAKMIVIFCLSFHLNLNAQSWPMVNGCRERTSWAEGETVLLPPLDLTTEFPLRSGDSPSGISFFDNVLFVSTDGLPSRLDAIDTQTGEEIWSFDIPNAEFSVALVPAVNDSMVLCGGQHGLGLHALDRFTGAEIWFKEIGCLYAKHPIMDSNRIYIVGDSLYCLDTGNGATIWSVPFASRIYPAVDKDNVYTCGEYTILALDKHTGDTLWQMDNSQSSYSSIAVDKDYVYTYNYDTIQALNKEDHSLEWFYEIPDRQFSPAATNAIAITDSFLCVSVWENPDKKGELYVLEKATGKYRWHHVFDTIGVFSPIIANGFVYVIKWHTYAIWGFDLQTGEPVFYNDSLRYFNQPIIVDGKLYVGSDRKIVTFENYGTGSGPALVEGNGSPVSVSIWPNPFKQSVNLQLRMDRSDFVDIKIYDLSGKKVKTISSRYFEAGIHTLSWDGIDDGSRKVPPGLYILKLSSGQNILTKRIMLLE